MHFDLANVQAIGIGASAFLITLMAVFLLIFAFNDRTARAMFYAFVVASLWAWCGFFYSIAESLDVARMLRVLSSMGVVGFTALFANFAFVYTQEFRPLSALEKYTRFALLGAAFVLIAVQVFDLGVMRNFVGSMPGLPSEVLAPNPGPYLPLIIAYHGIALLIMAFVLAARIFAASDRMRRRQAVILAVGLTVGIALGFPRWAAWYGYDILAQLTILAAPLLITAAFYAIKSYKLFNVQVAMAEIFIFIMWGFLFVRIILSESLSAALPDIVLFAALLVLGALLIRTILKEQRLAKEVQTLMLDRAKGEFVEIAAHQLRTPVAALRWSFNLLASEDQSKLSDTQKMIIEKGNRAADNMANLVNDLLNVARMSDGKFTYSFGDANLSAAARAAYDALEHIAKVRNITVAIDSGLSAFRFNFDKDKIALVLQNLIDNAIKYSPEGSSVSVHAEKSELRGKDAVLVRVADSGVGISAADQKRLFEKFFRSEKAKRMFTDGSGLGLIIVKTIVEGHGGEVDIDSEEGRGTTVSIVLPLSR